MDQRRRVSLKTSAKPSKSIAVIAICVALLLSYFLVKTFFYKQKVHYANKSLALPKIEQTQSETDKSPEDNGWKIVKTRSGDSMASVFGRAGLSRKTLQEILSNNKHAKKLTQIKTNQEIQLLIRHKVLEKLILPFSTTQYLVISHEGARYITKIKSRKMNGQDDYLTATVQGSLYGTAKRLNIPYKLVRQMTEIFNWEIDFVKDIRSGDQFSIVYKAYYIDDKLVNTGDILAVSYTNRGITHQAIRHVSANGDYDYFTPQGNSLKKAFSRYPIKFSHISSTFSLSRKHPILHYSRPHKGIDLAASIGTPVHATGDGRVVIIDRQSGYGNMIKISHNKMYSSVYGHLLKFQKGLSRGDRVKRGQVIGYVGQTGLATGPHCHYEFHIHSRPKNPATIELPRASPVPRHEMASFKAKSMTLLAQLKLFEEATLAAIGKKSPDTA